MSRSTLLALFVLAVIFSASRADMKAPDPLPQRLARATAVFVGKVKAIEGKTFEQESWPGSGSKMEYKIAVLSVDERLLGPAAKKEYRVAFAGPSRRSPHHDLKVGQEGLFFLTAIDGQPAYRFVEYTDVVNKASDNYATDRDLARRCGKLLDDPDKGLAAKSAQDRFLTAALLVLRYRQKPLALSNRLAEELVPAATTKKLLLTLADADWDAGRTEFSQLTPHSLFIRLGATAKHGWNQPRDRREIVPAAKTWLTENAGTFPLKHWVIKRAEDDPEPKK